MSIYSTKLHLQQNYDLKYNTVGNKLYYKKKKETKFKFLDERNYNSLYIECKELERNLNKGDFGALVNSKLSKEFNPFEEYFYNLPPWDGKTDYIEKLAETVKTNSTWYWKKYFKKWLVNVVACCLDRDTPNHIVLIFVGRQGLGKTTWLNKLLPPELRENYYSGIIKPDDKDNKVRMSECMFINMDEFETIGKKSLKSLKSTVTENDLRVRRPYATMDVVLSRRASFMASVNDFEFLVDETGNRRYLVLETKKINDKHNINLKKVYSQCMYLWKDKFKYYHTMKDHKRVNRKNERYMIKTLEEELVLKYFKPTPKKTGKVMTSTEILQYINSKTNKGINRTSVYNIGRSLSKHGFTRGRNKIKAHGWWVKPRLNRKKSKNDFN